MALQVAAVLSGPRAVAGHRHLELFVLMSRFVRSDDHHEDCKGKVNLIIFNLVDISCGFKIGYLGMWNWARQYPGDRKPGVVINIALCVHLSHEAGLDFTCLGP